MIPNTRSCPNDCDEGKVHFSGVHPSRVGDVSTMTTPDEWIEVCETCDGRGVIEERRENVREEDDLWTDYKRLSVRCINLATTIKRLQREIAALKETPCE